MKNLIDALPQHIEHALEIYKATKLQPLQREVKNIIITGLGGSGIGASIVSEVLATELSVPVTVNKDYTIPAFAGENTLVLACSYSGNTEETIAAVEAAIAKKCMIASMSSGGKLADLAAAHNWNHFMVPGGNPPRSMLGYSLVLLFGYFYAFKLSKHNPENWVNSVADLLRKEASDMENRAVQMTDVLERKIAAVYACDGMSAVAERVRQQLNENSKMVGWNSAIPEMNHNELVGWHFEHPNIAVILLRHAFENPRNAIRAELNKAILSEKTPNVLEIWAKGKDLIEATFYMIHLTDKLSGHLAQRHGVDIFDIKVIDFLKGELAGK